MSDMQHVSEIIKQSAPAAEPLVFDKDLVSSTIRHLGIRGDIQTVPAVVTGQWRTYRVRFFRQKGEPAEKIAIVEKSGEFTVVATGPDWMEVAPADMPADVLADLRRQSTPDTASDDEAVLRRVTGYIKLKITGGLRAGLLDTVKPAPALGVYSVTMVNKISKTLIAQLVPANGLIFVSANPDDPYTMRVRIPTEMYASLGIAPVVDATPADPGDATGDASTTGADDDETEEITPAKTPIPFPQNGNGNPTREAEPADEEEHARNFGMLPNHLTPALASDETPAAQPAASKYSEQELQAAEAIKAHYGMAGEAEKLLDFAHAAADHYNAAVQPGDALPPNPANEHAEDGTFADPIETERNQDLDEAIRPDLEEQLGVVQTALASERSLRAGNLAQIKTADETNFALMQENDALRQQVANLQTINQFQSDALREVATPKTQNMAAFWYTTVITPGVSFEDCEIAHLLQEYDFLFPATTHDAPGQSVFTAYLVRKPSPAPQPAAAADETEEISPRPISEAVGSPFSFQVPVPSAFQNAIADAIADALNQPHTRAIREKGLAGYLADAQADDLAEAQAAYDSILNRNHIVIPPLADFSSRQALPASV